MSNIPLRLYPRPRIAERQDGEFFFGKKVYLHIPKGFVDHDQIKLFRELFSNFTAGLSRLVVVANDWDVNGAVLSNEREQGNCISDDREEMDYCLYVDREKATLLFHDKASFSHCFCTLLSQIEVRNAKAPMLTLPVCQVRDVPVTAFRGIHVCIFPETKFDMMKKFVRMIGFTKYSHLIMEFWGTFKFRCCKGMYGPNAYSYRQVKELVREANAFGVEVIPMLNVLGHASQSRSIYCKHTTLDNYPGMAPIFEPDGWTWNLPNPDTVDLIHRMVRELCTVFGPGNYFHLGCDESHSYGSSRLFDGKDKTVVMYSFINGLAAELQKLGRRAMMWGDQLLNEPGRFDSDNCITYGETPEIARMLLDNLDKSIIITDWQYYVQKPDIPTASFLRENGFDVILAPCTDIPGLKACAGDVVRHNYMGFLQTTWAGLHGYDTRVIQRGATYAWEGDVDLLKMDTEFIGFETASYFRRLMPPGKDYYFSGIKEKQIEV